MIIGVIFFVLIAVGSVYALWWALKGYQDEIDGYAEDLKEWEEDQKKRGI